VNALRAELRKLLTLPSLRLTVLLTVCAHVLLLSVSAPAPLRYTQAGFVVFGVLSAGSEHQGGDQIRATLLAMPRRLPLYAAKVLALAMVTLPFAAVAGSPGYLTLTTLLAAGTGTLIRHTEAGAVLLLCVYFVGCPLLRARVPDAAAYLPDTAVLDLSRGAAATAIWTVAAVVPAAYAFHRRDA
jgi:ABC-2 type transport system permease protein